MSVKPLAVVPRRCFSYAERERSEGPRGQAHPRTEAAESVPRSTFFGWGKTKKERPEKQDFQFVAADPKIARTRRVDPTPPQEARHVSPGSPESHRPSTPPTSTPQPAATSALQASLSGCGAPNVTTALLDPPKIKNGASVAQQRGAAPGGGDAGVRRAVAGQGLTYVLCPAGA